ncbi:15272_t:CDS:2 [Funneliformis geosporum]|uniref:Mediator of RNA polymerase II transcription subunit 18 n=1 Tax=Funneliformis geosporum TaxID=1117311 RepID=A0A9W4WRG1_9GLOM|nr:15272_t:CDS:2 [Funneliformis geosporum]CAI2181106.1 10796_t:CDS:2 [Funneliformis geosporum]
MEKILFECSLHGHISNNLKEKLLDRLIGICGTHPIPIFEHEIGFVPTIQSPEGPERNEDVLLRLKSPIEENDLTKRQWILCQLGLPETRTGRTVTVRPVLYSKISTGDALKFMNVLGYRLVNVSTPFNFKEIIKYQLDVQLEVTKLTPYDPKENWMVEVTTIPVPQDQVDAYCSELRLFDDSLKGILNLFHVDHLVLQNKIHYS